MTTEKYEKWFSRIEAAGEFIKDESGYIVYWPPLQGCYNSAALRALADELDRRNADWEAKVTAANAFSTLTDEHK